MGTDRENEGQTKEAMKKCPPIIGKKFGGFRFSFLGIGA
jgi:hypothetical protein